MSKEKRHFHNIEETYEAGGGYYIDTKVKQILDMSFPEVGPDSMIEMVQFTETLLLPLVLLSEGYTKYYRKEGDSREQCRRSLLVNLNDFLEFHLRPFLESRIEFLIKDCIKEEMKEFKKEIMKKIGKAKK